MESSYYVAPDEAGEKPYSLLFEGLKRTGYVALAKVAMHNREHIVILRPGVKGIILHTMYYADEVRKVEEFRTDSTLVKDKELALATTLIESLAAPFEPEKYKDGYRENLMTMIKAKVEGRELVEAPEAEKLAPVVDIMEALKMSLAQAKKPVRFSTGAAGEEEEASKDEASPKRSRKSSATG
jgi:DNA end-binding protein Ku